MEKMPLHNTRRCHGAQDLETTVPSLPWAGGGPGCVSLRCPPDTAGSGPVAHGASGECWPCRAYGARAGNPVKLREAKLSWDKKQNWAFHSFKAAGSEAHGRMRSQGVIGCKVIFFIRNLPRKIFICEIRLGLYLSWGVGVEGWTEYYLSFLPACDSRIIAGECGDFQYSMITNCSLNAQCRHSNSMLETITQTEDYTKATANQSGALLQCQRQESPSENSSHGPWAGLGWGGVKRC